MPEQFVDQFAMLKRQNAKSKCYQGKRGAYQVWSEKEQA